ncbi:MAG: S1 domain-containing RNA-binding protein [Negativicoccus massiliensis]|nr:S1 domain-containing RNA-binding protein [Negativicoccus massiliensis]MDU5027321.1 S1 domain-containing RNA-binding protein [Negativicoccus succinicivorans]
MSVTVGSIVEGVVTGLAKFGAFVELPDKKVGLVHISEVAHEYVSDINEYLTVDQKVTVKVVSMDANGKIALSMKQAQPRPQTTSGRAPRRNDAGNAPYADRRPPAARRGGNRRSQGPSSFEDKLSRFLKDSDERLSDLKRNTESKRGGRGARRSD